MFIVGRTFVLVTIKGLHSVHEPIDKLRFLVVRMLVSLAMQIEENFVVVADALVG